MNNLAFHSLLIVSLPAENKKSKRNVTEGWIVSLRRLTRRHQRAQARKHRVVSSRWGNRTKKQKGSRTSHGFKARQRLSPLCSDQGRSGMIIQRLFPNFPLHWSQRFLNDPPLERCEASIGPCSERKQSASCFGFAMLTPFTSADDNISHLSPYTERQLITTYSGI